MRCQCGDSFTGEGALGKSAGLEIYFDTEHETLV